MFRLSIHKRKILYKNESSFTEEKKIKFETEGIKLQHTIVTLYNVDLRKMLDGPRSMVRLYNLLELASYMRSRCDGKIVKKKKEQKWHAYCLFENSIASLQIDTEKRHVRSMKSFNCT